MHPYALILEISGQAYVLRVVSNRGLTLAVAKPPTSQELLTRGDRYFPLTSKEWAVVSHSNQVRPVH
jgi:hypothetical protein